MLSSPFQTELAIDTNMTVVGTHGVVADTHMMVSGTQAVVADAHTMIADIHRNVVTGQEGTSGQNHSVGAIFDSSITKYLHRLDSNQVCGTEYYTLYNLTFSQRLSWRISSPGAGGLFRTRRVG